MSDITHIDSADPEDEQLEDEELDQATGGDASNFHFFDPVITPDMIEEMRERGDLTGQSQ